MMINVNYKNFAFDQLDPEAPPPNKRFFQLKDPVELKKFFRNIPQNAFLAAITVPTECIILHTVAHHLANTPTFVFPDNKTPYQKLKLLYQHPVTEAPSNLELIKKHKFKLFKGLFSRVGYVLTGQGTRIALMEQIGKEPLDLVKVALLQNSIYPYCIWYNCRQTGKTVRESWQAVIQKSTSIYGNLSFFGRNFLAAFCYYPGIVVQKNFSATYGENSATVGAIIVSLITSTSMNTLLKPVFTPGDATVLTRCAIATKFPARTAMCIRELVSVIIFFTSQMKSEKK